MSVFVKCGRREGGETKRGYCRYGEPGEQGPSCRFSMFGSFTWVALKDNMKQ